MTISPTGPQQKNAMLQNWIKPMLMEYNKGARKEKTSVAIK